MDDGPDDGSPALTRRLARHPVGPSSFSVTGLVSPLPLILTLTLTLNLTLRALLNLTLTLTLLTVLTLINSPQILVYRYSSHFYAIVAIFTAAKIYSNLIH